MGKLKIILIVAHSHFIHLVAFIDTWYLEPFSISLLTHWVVEKIGFPLFFVLFFFFTLARQMLYHLSPACMPFCSGYFGDRVSLFAQASLDHSPMLRFPLSLGWQTLAPMPNFFLLRWGLANVFCSGWSETMILPLLAFSVAWDERHVSLCSAVGWDGISLISFLPPTPTLGWP
jgi:hypothetical protein